jgi:hypothetical protein
MAGGAMALMIAAYVFLFSPSDDERIRNELIRLAAAVEISGDAPNPISHFAHVKGELAEIFESDRPRRREPRRKAPREFSVRQEGQRIAHPHPDRPTENRRRAFALRAHFPALCEPA